MRFVLVHGGLHGAWCWDHLVPELRARGHHAVAVDQPGFGERRDEPQTLAGSRDAVVAAMAEGDVLVGHSFGCGVATLAADAAPIVAHVVYLAGPVPVEGQGISYRSPAALTSGEEVKAPDEGVLNRYMQLTADGSAFTFDLEGATAAFYHDCPPELARWAYDRLVPNGLAIGREPVSVPTFWASAPPRSYIRCTDDRAWTKAASAWTIARLGVEPLEIQASHSPFLSRPGELADLLVHAAGTTPTGRLLSDDLPAG